MKISIVGLALIQAVEGYRASWYKCAAGKPTIGYGHVIVAGEQHYYQAKLSQVQALDLLRQDVDKKYGAHVANRLHRDVTQNQFDALVSLCYNIGTGGFDKSSVLALANAGSTSAVAIKQAFALWNKVTNPTTRIKEVSKGLTARRAQEAALYLS